MTQLINQPSLEPYINITPGSKILCPFCSEPMEEVDRTNSAGRYERATCRCNHLYIESGQNTKVIAQVSMVLSIEGEVDMYVEFDYEQNTFQTEQPVIQKQLFICTIPPINPFDIPTLIKKIKLYSTFS